MTSSCGAEALADPRRAASEPAPGEPRPRASRTARWRAAVLIGVHLVIAVHVGHWMATGRTLTPLEPSEAMQFSQQSLVNAGLVLFGLAIVSTALLGRFFCGWGCHVVALQDLCRWLLGKLGVRPKPIALGPLAVVPWLAFVYMFLAPAAWRLLADVRFPPVRAHFTTEAFWATFPGPWVALVTFLACGFAIVYLLGAKGFCTYGCPYGGIFGAVDQLAPWRIRVSDACEGCGHCTAVCSSNVVVHQEVRDWGMVVDPGCMKCLDCVSVCPKDALRVGLGAPALFARRRRGAPSRERAPEGAKREAVLRTLLLALFVPAALAAMLAFDGPLDWGHLLALSLFSLVVAHVFRGRSQRVAGTSLVEDLVLGGLFLAALWTFRGWRGLVPLLFSLGLAAMLAWLGLLALRLVTRRRVLLQRLVLRNEGRLTVPGRAFAAVVLPAIAFGGWVLVDRAAESRRLEQALASYHDGVEHALAGRFGEAAEAFGRTLALVPENVEARENLAGMLCSQGRFREGALEYERALALAPDAETHRLAARAWEAAGDPEAAERHRAAAQELEPGPAALRR